MCIRDRLYIESNGVDKEAMNMDFPKIHESEYRFCLIMWEYEPVTAAPVSYTHLDVYKRQG